MNQAFTNVITKMKEENINQFIICDPGSIYYLTHQMFHTGHRMLALLISQDKDPILFIHEMFPTQAMDGVKVHYFKDTDDYLTDLYNELDSSKQVGVDKFFEARYVIGLSERGLALPLKVTSYIIDDIRAVKSNEEITLMENASAINDKVMAYMQDYIHNYEGTLTENHLKDVLQEQYALYTDEGYSFPPIFGFGVNAANPHHRGDDTILKDGDCIVMDMGCVKDNYCSDMTRTVFYKSVSDFNREIYEIVKEAHLRAFKAVKPGMKASEIDAIARDYISEKGYGQYFTHRLGHFIGTETHEAGDISAANNDVLVEGNIFSIEPGIYIKDKNIGVRIENLVRVTKDGAVSLNHLPLDLKVL